MSYLNGSASSAGSPAPAVSELIHRWSSHNGKAVPGRNPFGANGITRRNPAARPGRRARGRCGGASGTVGVRRGGPGRGSIGTGVAGVATAAKSLMGDEFGITAHRGDVLDLPPQPDIVLDIDPDVVVSIHPSAICGGPPLGGTRHPRVCRPTSGWPAACCRCDSHTCAAPVDRKMTRPAMATAWSAKRS